MRPATKTKILKAIEKQVRGFNLPSVSKVAETRDPYRVLVSCILSLRTKDKTTIEASQRLFKAAADPESMLKLNETRLRKIIYPVSFYRNKSRVILGLSKRILKENSGKVPDTLEGLLDLKGVGRKTANLVLGLGFGIPAICVDTHVHRISNRLGWVKTKTPEETEFALREIIPRSEWIKLNTTLVTFGQNICVPVSPFCSRCDIKEFCPRKGVVKWR